MQCALLFSGKGNCRSSVSKRTGALLYTVEGNCWSTVFHPTKEQSNRHTIENFYLLSIIKKVYTYFIKKLK